jgi:integrase/recombinase XerD
MPIQERCDDQSDEPDVWLRKLTDHLIETRYGDCAPDRVWTARRFLAHLEKVGLTVHTVQQRDVEKYLRALKPHSRSRHRVLSDSRRAGYRAGIHMLLRLVHGRWPIPAGPRTDRESFHRELVQQYDFWMRDLRGLCASTRSRRCANALRFLQWLGDRGDRATLSEMTVADIDAYVQWRASPLQRSAKKVITVHLRSFLQQLHTAGLIGDLCSVVVGPKLYALEGIPSALSAEEIKKVLQFVRQDRSPMGLRDYATLTLLSTYGLRAGEITALRLEDIDWTHDRLRIRHSKTGVHSELPLLRVPGEALVDYLRKGRPTTARREVFLRANAPYLPFRSGSSLYKTLSRRLKGAGVTPQGRKGPRAFRHSRATGLLGSGVPLKVIGDVLGHRATRSTMSYLKLDLESLRMVALEIPRGL